MVNTSPLPMAVALDLKNALRRIDILSYNRRMKKKEFLSAGEAARALGISVNTIQRGEKAGLLPVIRTATVPRPSSVVFPWRRFTPCSMDRGKRCAAPSTQGY
jgi:hypothetical protein